jgi:DNA gyrase subunit A
MIAIQTGGRNGKVVAAKLVRHEDEIMLITTGGVLIRTRVVEIRQMGRATQGVTLINLGDEEKLAGLEKVVESEENGTNGAVGDATTAIATDDIADAQAEDNGEAEPGEASDDGENRDDGDAPPPDEPDEQS